MYTIRMIDGFTFKIHKTTSAGALPKELSGKWSSRAEAEKALKTHMSLVHMRSEAIKKKELDKQIRRRRTERARAKGK